MICFNTKKSELKCLHNQKRRFNLMSHVNYLYQCQRFLLLSVSFPIIYWFYVDFHVTTISCESVRLFKILMYTFQSYFFISKSVLLVYLTRRRGFIGSFFYVMLNMSLPSQHVLGQLLLFVVYLLATSAHSKHFGQCTVIQQQPHQLQNVMI